MQFILIVSLRYSTTLFLNWNLKHVTKATFNESSSLIHRTMRKSLPAIWLSIDEASLKSSSFYISISSFVIQIIRERIREISVNLNGTDQKISSIFFLHNLSISSTNIYLFIQTKSSTIPKKLKFKSMESRYLYYPYRRSIHIQGCYNECGWKQGHPLTLTPCDPRRPPARLIEPPATDLKFHQIISNFQPPIRSSHLYRRYKVRLRKRKGSETRPRVEQPSRQWRKARVDAPQRSSRALAHAIDTLDSRGFHVPARRHDTRAEQDRGRTRPTETGRGSASRGSSSRRREHGPNRHRRFDVVDTFLPPDRPRGNPSFGSRIILVPFSPVTAIERVIRVNRSRWDASRARKCDSPVVCSSFDFGKARERHTGSDLQVSFTIRLRLRGYLLTQFPYGAPSVRSCLWNRDS